MYLEVYYLHLLSRIKTNNMQSVLTNLTLTAMIIIISPVVCIISPTFLLIWYLKIN